MEPKRNVSDPALRGAAQPNTYDGMKDSTVMGASAWHFGKNESLGALCVTSVNDYIAKPVKMEQLTEVLERACVALAANAVQP